jgi:hypothetical protein
MTPLILAIAAGVVVVIGVGIVIAMRSRGEDEGARFRHIADITSTWSRQSGGSETWSRENGGNAGTETDRPLPYPNSNAAQSPLEPESDATTSGRSHTSRPHPKGR